MKTEIKPRLIHLGSVSCDTRAIQRIGHFEGFMANMAWL